MSCDRQDSSANFTVDMLNNPHFWCQFTSTLSGNGKLRWWSGLHPFCSTSTVLYDLVPSVIRFFKETKNMMKGRDIKLCEECNVRRVYVWSVYVGSVMGGVCMC